MATPNVRDHRPKKQYTPTLQSWKEIESSYLEGMKSNVSIDCGWGNLIFAHTFEDSKELLGELLKERPGRRDIAFYVKDPHVLLSEAPSDIFLDPSHTFRLWFENYKSQKQPAHHVNVRRLQKKSDVQAINQVLISQGMVPFQDDYVWKNRNSRTRTLLLAETLDQKEIVGFVMGINHKMAFNDPEMGSSLWSLCVAKNSSVPKVGETLVRRLTEHYIASGCSFIDLSVMHNNTSAMGLYEKLGFERVPVFAIKRKNAINQQLFSGPLEGQKLNPYSRIIVDEAQRRGIKVDIVDEPLQIFQLSLGGVVHTCRESLTDMTSSIAFIISDNKRLSSNILARNGFSVPEQVLWKGQEEEKVKKLLKKSGSLVVKPCQGEQGRGVAVDLKNWQDVREHIEFLEKQEDEVVVEEHVDGHEVRVIVIDYQFVAAAVRRPPEVTGTGQHTVQELIEHQSRRRLKETSGESEIPFDDITKKCVREKGYEMADILPEGEVLRVRKNTNLHTGGTIHDVTEKISPYFREVSESAAHCLELPVVGLDFIVPDFNEKKYWILEANERPGLANHEPQPTAERFIDFLFPSTASLRPAGEGLVGSNL